MDRRRYLAAFAAVVGAGCASTDTTPGHDSENSSTETTPDRRSDEPPSDFPTDHGLWRCQLPDRFALTATSDALYVAKDAALVCLSPAGETRWATDSDTDSYAIAEPHDLTVAGSTVYYTARASTKTGEVGAYDTASGQQRWATTLGEVPDSLIGVTEDTVFASQSYDDPGEAPVFAFDAETGDEQWRTKTGMDMGSAVADGLCLVYSVVDGLTALDTATGEVQWEQALGGEYGARLRVIDDTLCLFLAGTVHGYELQDGTHRWEQSLPGNERFVQRPPLSATEAADLYIADDQASLTALTAATGEKQWTVATSEDDEGYEGLCLGTETLFYHSGTVLASYDLVDGTRRWRYPFESEYDISGPFVADGTVFLITLETEGEPSVRAFDAESGRLHWRRRLSTGESFPPRISGVFDEYAALRTDTGLIGFPVSPSTP
ncbi:PQQ-binding-like beta-propeller repeat protein [Halosimplex sp. TS25]|uniref:outer membrane protein assembly factor BamB family protein n=1 Tax=Halosimplex rarum TaxID=3396619 RepID=UPI0039E7A5AF